MLYTSYCTTQDENRDLPHIYGKTIRQTIADKLNELEAAAPIEPFAPWLMSTQAAETQRFQYHRFKW
jgi:hypothetical protein